MTRETVATILAGTQFPIAYRSFPIGKAPSTTPFLIYFYEGNDDMMADNKNYVNIVNLVVELYTSGSREFSSEATVEAILNSNHMTHTKTEEYIEDISMYRITYEMEVIING